ncbi:MAG: class I SAM-dependent methyltransferase [Anaeromyxobacter sp.]
MVAAYFRAFAPTDPVALVLALEAGPGRPTPEQAGDAVLALVRESGRAEVPEVLIVDAATELLDTLRQFDPVHPVGPLAAAPDGAAARLAAALRPPEAAPAPPRPPPGPSLLPSLPPGQTFSAADLPALVRHMAFSGEGTDACLAAGALPMQVHYYSPVPDLPDLDRRQVFGRRSPLAGIDFREQAQLELLAELGRRFGAECAWPVQPPADPRAFHLENGSFSYGCAASTHAFIRRSRPRRVIEVGSGWSTRVISAALARNAAEGAPPADYTVIDPYPGPVIRALPGISELVPQRVEETSLERFERLGDGDLLFIDSSHVVKIGGDVNFLYLEVLPRLAPGVLVHIHDISLPFEYGRAYYTNPKFRVFWTEAYLLQAFLACNNRFEVLMGLGWLQQEHLPAFRAAFPAWDPERSPTQSGSFWIRRKGA